MTRDELRTTINMLVDDLYRFEGFDVVLLIVYNHELRKVIIGASTQDRATMRELLESSLEHTSDA